MLLIFPSIEISGGRCVNLVHGEPGSERTYSVDPVNMAILWRGENAKTLHIIDLEGVRSGRIRNYDVLRKIVAAVDIPIQVGGGLRSIDDVKALFDIGVYRVVLGTAAVQNPELVERLIREFGARKVAISIESLNGKMRIEGGKTETGEAPVDFALRMKKLGVCRILFSTFDTDGTTKKIDLEGLKSLALQSGIRITSQGGVRNYQDLLRLQEVEKYGIDSVIVGKPLYDNKFPCQRLWRINEQELTNLGPTRRM